MPEYRIIAKIDPSGVVDGRAKVSQELSGMESDVRRAGDTGAAAFDRMGAGSVRAGTAAAGLAGANRSVATEATAMAAAAQASARGLSAQADAVRLNSVAMRETLVVARELSRGNFTRLPGSLTLLGQGISSQGGLAAYASALGSTLGLLKKTQDAELSLSAVDAQAAASAVRAAAERAAANVQAADTEIALAEAQLRVTAGTSAEATAQARLAAAHEAVAAAAAESAIAEDAVAVAETRAGQAALAAATESTTTLNPWAIGLAVVTAAVVGLYFAFRDEESAVQKATDKLVDNAKKAEINRQAHELYKNTLEGEEEALRKVGDALDKVEQAGRTEAETEAFNAKLAELRIERTYREIAANLELAKSRLAANQSILTSVSSPEAREFAAQNQSAVQGQVNDLQARLDKTQVAMADAQGKYLRALADYSVARGERDQTEDIKRKYEGPGGLIEQANKAAQAAASAAKAAGNEVLAHRLVTTELTKQVELIRAKEKAELDAARRAEEDARRQGQILALPISGGTIGTRFGQIESGVGVGPHVHQGVDIRTPVGTPIYARAGGTVDYARQEGGYGNIIQINFGGGVSARYAHLSRFNVKPGDVVDAGDIVGYTGGARGAEGAGDSTGPHLHYEERVGGHPVNPLTTKVQLDTAGAQSEGYKKAEEAAKKAAEKAQAERDFVTATIDAANQTALPKIETLAAKIEKVLDAYKKQFHEAPTPAQIKAITGALTDADARATAQHFDEAYVQPLKALREGLGLTAVARQISNATIKEEHDLGRSLSPIEQQQIKDRYQLGDAYDREDKLVTALHQPLEDYKQQLLAINKALQDGKINQIDYNAELAKLNAPVRGLLDNAPGGYGQRGGINVTDPNAQPGDKGGGTRNYSSYEDAAKAQDENARYADELQNYQKYRDALQALGINYDQLEENAHKQHIDNLNAIDSARRDTQLAYGQQIADSTYQIAVAAFGKHSALARAAFAVEKGFVIARASLALYDDVAQAMSKGFPQNLPLIAAAFAQGLTIIQAIKSIAVPSQGGGYMAGGYTGDGLRDLPAGVVHGQEFVVNANATSRHRALLEAINSGRLTAESRGISNDNHAGGARPVSVQVHNYAPGVDFETQRGATPDEVVVIARRIVRDEAPGAVASDMSRPNSRTSKAMGQNFGVGRKRS